MSGQKVTDILFESELGMQSGPVMRHAHESQQEIELLQVARTEGAPQRLVRRRCVGGLKKDVRGAREKRFFFRTVGLGKGGNRSIKLRADREIGP